MSWEIATIIALACNVTMLIFLLMMGRTLIRLMTELSDAKGAAKRALSGHVTMLKRFAQLSNDYMSLLSCLPSDVKIPRRLDKNNPNARIRLGGSP